MLKDSDPEWELGLVKNAQLLMKMGGMGRELTKRKTQKRD